VALGGHGDAGLHVELLLRLRDESGQLVAPGHFIPAAERYGLMTLIDRWVVRNAFAVLAARLAEGADPISTCAINLSGATFKDEGFLDYVRDQFRIYRVPPTIICFEITETSAIANLADASGFIQALQAIGCRFSLDDFGSGMSSFAYLKHLPVDYLKIDGSFVKDMLTDPIDRAMVEMISHIGKIMGKRTVAEFVESDDIIRALREIEVDYAQGYAIGKPEPFDIYSDIDRREVA
jgi:EAL domain-containing protein (putative c-di-GMP-specific phosphodiesterase class I)